MALFDKLFSPNISFGGGSEKGGKPNLLSKLLEGFKQQPSSPNHSYHRPSGENNNNSGSNSGSGSWGGSNNIEKNKYDKFFDKNNAPSAFAVAGGYALGAAVSTVVHNTVEYVTDTVEMPVYTEMLPESDPISQFHVPGLGDLVDSFVLPFCSEHSMYDVGNIAPTANMNVAVNVQKGADIAV